MRTPDPPTLLRGVGDCRRNHPALRREPELTNLQPKTCAPLAIELAEVDLDRLRPGLYTNYNLV